MPKCGLCHFGAKRAPTAPLERLGAFGPLRTPKNVGHVCKSAKVDFCNFIIIFQKNKKLQKVTFALLHTCTTFSGVLRGQNRKVASFAFRSTLALPNRPSRIFSYVYDVFACSESSKSTFGALGAYLVESRRGPPSGYLGATLRARRLPRRVLCSHPGSRADSAQRAHPRLPRRVLCSHPGSRADSAQRAHPRLPRRVLCSHPGSRADSAQRAHPRLPRCEGGGYPQTVSPDPFEISGQILGFAIPVFARKKKNCTNN